MKVFLALPAYNEEKDLPALLESFREVMGNTRRQYQAVIVDDGSRDGTPKVIEEFSSKMSILSVCHVVNLGLGRTIQDALRKASEVGSDNDVIVTMDADNTHSPGLIPQMLEQIDKGYDLVIASRYRQGSKVIGLSLHRQFISYGASALFQLCFPIAGVRDYTCGFRAYKAEVLRAAFALYKDSLVTETGFACMAEILLKLRKMRVKMIEVPMVLHYDLKAGTSKMKVRATIWRTTKLIARNLYRGP